MSLHDWIFSVYPEGSGIKGAWSPLHIITLALVIGIIVAISFLRNKSYKVRRGVIITLASLILIFELARRIINFSRGYDFEWNRFLGTLLPRPWCAISCWFMIVSAILNKKFLYNITSVTGFLCTLIFFAYPSVGFNNKYILFENLYSICTHSLLMISTVSLITLKFTDFKYKNAWKELICLVAIYAYAFIEIYVLKIEPDPLYFMPDNEAQGVLGLSYSLYLVVYVIFLIVYFTAFYLVQGLIDKRKSQKAY